MSQAKSTKLGDSYMPGDKIVMTPEGYDVLRHDTLNGWRKIRSYRLEEMSHEFFHMEASMPYSYKKYDPYDLAFWNKIGRSPFKQDTDRPGRVLCDPKNKFFISQPIIFYP